MKTLVGIVHGFFSGFLVYMASAMLFTKGSPSTLFVFVTFFGSWALSSFVIIRGAKSVSKIFSRGFLLGAAEWLAMIPVGILFSGKAVVETTSSISQDSSGAVATGAAIGGGIMAFLTGGVAIFMTIVCLAGFAVSYFIGREMKPERKETIKKCPHCAELIQAEAKKCRYCGSELTTP